jgi:hypothetical protein
MKQLGWLAFAHLLLVFSPGSARTFQSTIAAPGNFTGTAVSSTSIQWSWNAVLGSSTTLGATHYELQAHTTNAVIANIPGPGTTPVTFTEIGLSPGTTYTRHVVAFSGPDSASTPDLSVTTLPAPPPASTGLFDQLLAHISAFQSVAETLADQNAINKTAAHTLKKESMKVDQAADKLGRDVAQGKNTADAAANLEEKAAQLLQSAQTIAQQAGLGQSSLLVTSADSVFQDAGALQFRESLPLVQTFVQVARTIPSTIPGIGNVDLTLSGEIDAGFTRIPGTDSATVTPIMAAYDISVVPSGGTSPILAGSVRLTSQMPSTGNLDLVRRNLQWVLNLEADFTVPAPQTVTMQVQVVDNFHTVIMTPLFCPCLSLEQAQVLSSSASLPSGVSEILTAGLFDG